MSWVLFLIWWHNQSAISFGVFVFAVLAAIHVSVSFSGKGQP